MHHVGLKQLAQHVAQHLKGEQRTLGREAVHQKQYMETQDWLSLATETKLPSSIAITEGNHSSLWNFVYLPMIMNTFIIKSLLNKFTGLMLSSGKCRYIFFKQHQFNI